METYDNLFSWRAAATIAAFVSIDLKGHLEVECWKISQNT